MGTCFGAIFLIVSGVLLMVSILRWFEQTRDAVDARNWSRLMLLIAMPPCVWLFPSRVSAGRPSAVPRHEPVRGFGGLPKGGIADPTTGASAQPISGPAEAATAVPAEPAVPTAQGAGDGPPPGTPAEFIGLPKIPPKKAPRAVDPEKLAKLRQKMKEQGMLPDEP
jgi:hypothetical protein